MQPLKLPASTLAAALLLWAIAGAAHAQATRLFTDWQAACDNLRNCAAIGMGTADVDSFGFIDLRRGAGANAEAQVSLAFTFETELQELPLEIGFDPPGPDNVFPREPKAEIGRDGMLRLDLPKESLAPFLAALRRAEFLRVRRLDDPPREQASTVISLKGAIAALRWIDEQQQRSGNVTALVSRGERPASSIPAPPAPPVLTRSPSQAQQIEGKAPADILALRKAACPDLAAESEGEEIGYQLTPDITLWQMPCAQRRVQFRVRLFPAAARQRAAPHPLRPPRKRQARSRSGGDHQRRVPRRRALDLLLRQGTGPRRLRRARQLCLERPQFRAGELAGNAHVPRRAARSVAGAVANRATRGQIEKGPAKRRPFYLEFSAGQAARS